MNVKHCVGVPLVMKIKNNLMAANFSDQIHLCIVEDARQRRNMLVGLPIIMILSKYCCEHE